MAAHDPSNDGTKSVVKSGVQLEKQSFTWIIENFDIVRKCDELISGQKFNFTAGDTIGLPTSWEFSLDQCEIGGIGPKVKWKSIYLRLLKTPKDVKEVTVGRRIRCTRADGSTYVGGEVPFRQMNVQSTGRGWSQFFKADKPVEDLPLVNGSLIMEIDFTLYAIKPQTSVLDVPTQVKAFETRAVQKLIKDLGQTGAATGCNVDSVTKLISIENVEFPVNRGILSVRSPVFQRMFQSGMKEAKTGVVRIDDLAAKTLTVLLRYIMTGTLHEDWNSSEVILELPYAAHKYELGLLVDFLDQVLGSICTIGNAKQLAFLANKLEMKAERDLLAFIREKAAGIKSLEDLTMLMDTTN